MQTLLSLILKFFYLRAKTNQAKDNFYYTLCLLLLVSTLFLNYHTYTQYMIVLRVLNDQIGF